MYKTCDIIFFLECVLIRLHCHRCKNNDKFQTKFGIWEAEKYHLGQPWYHKIPKSGAYTSHLFSTASIFFTENPLSPYF